MNLRILTIGTLIPLSCFAASDETGFSFNFKETENCIQTTMHNPPIHFSDRSKVRAGHYRDYVKDLCLTITKNPNGTYNLNYNVQGQRHASNLELSGLELSNEKLAGTIFSTIEIPRVAQLYSGNIKTIDELSTEVLSKMKSYIAIINLFSTPANNLFLDDDILIQIKIEDLDRKRDQEFENTYKALEVYLNLPNAEEQTAYLNSLSPEERKMVEKMLEQVKKKL